MGESLDVYINDALAGVLRQEHGRLAFGYNETWTASKAFIPLSITMPPRTGEYPDEIARPFFENLLPEGEIRAAIARLRQVSETNTFGLLEEIGGDCAGAVSLRPHGQALPTTNGYTPVSDEQLKDILAQLGKRPLIAMDGEVRLSLAGAQDKLPVYYDGAQIFLPRGISPSSHILKPGSRGYEHMPINEHFCMRLAHALGLPVPNSEILRKPGALYLIARYDRKPDEAGSITRIHQIDFCQALNLPSSRKYEKEGGPDLEQCFELVARESAQPAADRLRLIDWVTFNFLVGNADAHGKNLSLLVTPGGIRMAPFYDLISTAIYPNLATTMAMKIGGENRPDWIQARHWDAFAEKSGANPRFVKGRVAELSTTITTASGKLLHELAATPDETVTLEKICAEIAKRGKRLSGMNLR